MSRTTGVDASVTQIYGWQSGVFGLKRARVHYWLSIGIRSTLATVALVGLCISQTQVAHAGKKVHDVEYIPQEKIQWCWASTAQAAIDYYKDDVGQCEIVESIHGGSCPDKAGLLEDQATVMLNEGVESSICACVFTFSTITSGIDDDDLFIGSHGDAGGGTGHVTLLFGYNDSGDQESVYFVTSTAIGCSTGVKKTSYVNYAAGKSQFLSKGIRRMMNVDDT